MKFAVALALAPFAFARLHKGERNLIVIRDYTLDPPAKIYYESNTCDMVAYVDSAPISGENYKGERTTMIRDDEQGKVTFHCRAEGIPGADRGNTRFEGFNCEIDPPGILEDPPNDDMIITQVETTETLASVSQDGVANLHCTFPFTMEED